MWKDYSWSYIKNNRASSLSIGAAAFLSALFLSLLCSLFYNFWKYDVERIRLEEGDWHARITGEMDREDITAIEQLDNVEKVTVHEELSDGQKVTLDLCLTNMRAVLEEMPQIAGMLSLDPEKITYHHALLSMYLIRDPQDPAPRLIFPFFLAVAALACISLVLIIHNSFAVSMDARMHQFGIFSSIGATPRQIRACLLQEAFALCAVPAAAGDLLGIGAGRVLLGLTNRIAGEIPGRREAVWGYHPLALAFTVGITVLTVWFSAWLPAGKMSRLTPMEAIKHAGEPPVPRKKKFSMAARLFGVEGELAGNALRARKKELRTSTVSLALAFLAFTLMECFFTLSDISTQMTYFERYQDVWDVMVTVKDSGIDGLEETEELRELPDARSVMIYEKSTAKSVIAGEAVSEELEALGGLANAPEQYVTALTSGWLVDAPIFILDDHSFLAYCEQIGAPARLDGAVVLNRIRDGSNPDFRHPVYLPYVEERSVSVLCRPETEDNLMEIPVLSYTDQAPGLREEYGTLNHYELVHFLPVSLWREIKGQIGETTGECFVQVLAREDVTAEELAALQAKVERILGKSHELESENRIQEKLLNDRMIGGVRVLFGGFCVLLALIGIGNVFSNTMGFVRQRKREFAQYLSVGLTPSGMKNLFFVEALLIAGRPALITLPLTAAAVGFMLRASYLSPLIFLREAPVLPVLMFLAGIFGFVALAYYLGWRQLKKISLADALRDDTLY